MLCEECGIREATVIVSFVAPNGNTTKHLCADCMKAKQQEILRGNIGALLGSVMNAVGNRVSKTEQTEKVCPQCGCSLAEFRQTGRLGCSGCYSAFREELSPLIRGSSQGSFRGEMPSRQPERSSMVLSMTIENLKEKMLQAVTEEDYETAAKIRDEIRTLSEKAGEAEK